jgi:homoserine dehydrogenase
MSGALRVAVAGLGTVGGGTVRLLQAQRELIGQRCGREIVVTAVSALERPRDRGFDVSAARWYEDAVTMAREAEADVVVELIGGSGGVAKAVCETALGRGCHVVTANKALIAHHGTALARLAETGGLSLGFEAAVAGGIPVIKALREGLAGNAIREIHGILNGTCNYILTKMRATGRSFADVLAEAQALGYAEADPSFDIDGIDAAHKLAILAAVAFGCPVRFVPENVEGIRQISAEDFKFAESLGYRIKLLGITRRDGALLEQRVHPCLVPISAPIASVDDVFNAVVIEGDFVDRVMLQGRGAGAGPTASAVVADLIDIACGRTTRTFVVPADRLDPIEPAPLSARRGAYYLRLMVRDEVGVLASIAGALSDAGVSIAKFFQDERDPGEKVPVVMTTHETDEAAMMRALDKIKALGTVLEPPRMIRIERF